MAKRTREDYEEAYPFVLYHFALSLRLRHPTMSAKQVKAELKMRPEVSHSVGERRKDRHGARLPGEYRETYLCFRMKIRVGQELPNAISKILTKLEPHALFLNDLRATGGSLEFFIGVFVEGNKGVTFESDLVRKCADLGIDIAMDIYGTAK